MAQITGAERSEFALVGGVKLATSSKLPAQMTGLLQFIKDNPKSIEPWPQLEMEFDAIDSFPVHRLPVNLPEEADEPFKRMFGKDNVSLYIYASSQAVWCAFGGESALQSLKNGVESA